MNDPINGENNTLNYFDKEFIKDIVLTTTNTNVYFISESFDNFQIIDNYLRSTYLPDNFHFEDGVKNLLSNCDNRKVYRIIDNFDLNYIFMKLFESKEYIAIGPYTNYILENNDILKILKQNNLDLKHQFSFREFYSSIPVILEPVIVRVFNNIAKYIYRSETNYLVELLDASFNSVHTKEIFIEEQPDISLTMKILEERYQMENKLLEAVRTGNRRDALSYLTKITLNSSGPYMLPKIEDIRNKCIMLNTLYRKAVEDAYVHPIYLDEISRKYNIKIQEIKNISVLENTIINMTREYCDLVLTKSLKDYSPIIRSTINYINLNINNKISLSEIAESINVNDSYLSNYFKNEMRITLTEYINEEKIRKACTLLESTNLQIQDIAYSVGFYDVNYFTKLFKKITALTPSKYRTNYKTKPSK